MTPAVRAFYTRYYLLTALAPAYLMALVFYGAAWLLSPASPLRLVFGGPVFFGFGVFVFIGLSRILGALGFLLAGVPRARVAPGADERRKLHEALDGALAAPAEPGLSASRPPPDAVVLEPVLVELGPVPFLSIGGFLPNQLWISTHTLRNTDARALSFLCAHERGHVATGGGCACAWYDALWLVAYPLAVLFADAGMPLLTAAAALLHAIAWIRLTYQLRLRAEARADRWAVERTDRRGYALALVKFHRQIAGRASSTARLRLRRLGFSEEEIEDVLSAGAAA
jgi:hypothetical protein